MGVRIVFDNCTYSLDAPKPRLSGGHVPSYAQHVRPKLEVDMIVVGAVLTVIFTFALLAAPPAAQAQPAGKVYRIGFLSISGSGGADLRRILLDGLRERGYVEGRNLEILLRHSDGKIDLLPEAATELVRARPDVIVTSINATTRAALKATQTIPIVMVIGTDVVREGFIATLAKPGGNVTGLTFQADGGQIAKRFEFLKELIPRVSRIAALWDPGQDAPIARSQLEQGAAAVAARLIVLEFQDDLDALFAAAVREGAQALITGGGTRMFRRRKELVALAAKHRLADVHYTSEFVEAGGLMSYAPSLPDNYKRAAAYVDRILKGASPADLPVEQPSRFELVVNPKAAQVRGLTLPQSILIRADRVIE
jgi:putative ABC transport system substrate-binding protein